MGRSQVVRQRVLVPSFAGSSPAAPVFLFNCPLQPTMMVGGSRRLLKIEALATRTHWAARYSVLGRARSAACWNSLQHETSAARTRWTARMRRPRSRPEPLATGAPCVLASHSPSAPPRRGVTLERVLRASCVLVSHSAQAPWRRSVTLQQPAGAPQLTHPGTRQKAADPPSARPRCPPGRPRR